MIVVGVVLAGLAYLQNSAFMGAHVAEGPVAG